MVTVRAFGALDLRDAEGAPLGPVLAQTKRAALFAYLLLSRPGEFCRRDTLLAVFWPESDPVHGRNALSQALSFLRRELGEDVMLRRGGEEVAVDLGQVGCDVLAFHEAMSDEDWAGAVELYRGDFLDGLHVRDAPAFVDWVDRERGRLKEMVAGAAWRHAHQLIGARKLVEAERTAQRALDLVPTDDSPVRELIEALATAGDRGAALRFYKKFEAVLAAELGVAPDPETEALVRAVRKGEVRALVSPAAGDKDDDPYAGLVSSWPDPHAGAGLVLLERQARASTGEAIPFVGREAEMERLRGFLERALAGEGCAVFVTGEAGVGKTALVTEFCRRVMAAHPNLVVAGGDGNAHIGPGDPYLPFREILGLLTGDVEARYAAGSISREAALRLWNLIPASLGALLDVGPNLIDTLLHRPGVHARVSSFAKRTNVPQGAWAAFPRISPVQAASLQLPALCFQFVRTLQAVARVHPLLLVLDDLQWADAESLHLLFELGRQLEGSRILVLCLYRSSEVALGRDGSRHPLEAVVHELTRRSGEVEVELGEGGDRTLVDALLDAEPNVLGEKFRNALFEQTRGHALFTVELLRAMRARRALVRDDAGRWIEGQDLQWNLLPARVEAVIAERIGRLPKTLQRVLSVASAEGEWFCLEAVAAVVGMEADDLRRTMCEEMDRVHRLVRVHGIQRLGHGRQTICRFSHLLFQRYLYGQIGQAEGSDIHRRLGEALEAVCGDEASGMSLHLARHFREGLQTEKAASYLAMAGERASRAGGHREAMGHFRAALDLLSSLPASSGTDRLIAKILIGLGHARLYCAMPGASEAFSRAQALAGRAGAVKEEFWGAFGVYLIDHRFGGDCRGGREVAASCRSFAQKDGSPLALAHGHYAVAHNAFMRGDLPSARLEFEAAIDQFERGGHAAGDTRLGYDVHLGAMCQGLLGLVWWRMGYPEKGRGLIADARAKAEAGRCPMACFWTDHYDVIVSMWEEDALGMKDRLRDMRQLADHHRITAFCGGSLQIFGCWADAHLGDPSLVLESMEEGVSLWEARGWEANNPLFRAMVGEIFCLAGRSEEGLRHVERGRASGIAREELWTIPEVLTTQGDLLLGLTDPDMPGAEASYRDAMQSAKEQGAKYHELRAALRLARLLQAQGRTKEARTMLSGIVGWFTEGFETNALREAVAVLATLDGPPPAAGPSEVGR